MTTDSLHLTPPMYRRQRSWVYYSPHAKGLRRRDQVHLVHTPRAGQAAVCPRRLSNLPFDRGKLCHQDSLTVSSSHIGFACVVVGSTLATPWAHPLRPTKRLKLLLLFLYLCRNGTARPEMAPFLMSVRSCDCDTTDISHACQRLGELANR